MPLLHPLLIFWHGPWCHSFYSAALFPQRQKQAMFQSTACEEHDASTARAGHSLHQAWKQEVDVSKPSGISPDAVMQKSCHPTSKETINTVTFSFDNRTECVGELGPIQGLRFLSESANQGHPWENSTMYKYLG